MNLIDLTAQAPTSYRVRTRRPEETTTVVLHQTGFAWKPSNPMWAKVRSHYVVRRDGSVALSTSMRRARARPISSRTRAQKRGLK